MTAEDILRTHAEELAAATGLGVDVFADDRRLFVWLKGVPLPHGWALPASDVLYVTDTAYPLSALDMFWTETGLTLASGAVAANTDAIEHYLDRDWRRFSWHTPASGRLASNPLLDHYALMEDRLAREVAA